VGVTPRRYGLRGVVSGISLNKGDHDGRGTFGQRLIMLLIVRDFRRGDTVVKPVVKLFSLPLFILTLG